MAVDETNKIEKLSCDHWEYVESVLVAHGTQKSIIDISRFHYVSAFLHGYKHGVEDQYND